MGVGLFDNVVSTSKRPRLPAISQCWLAGSTPTDRLPSENSGFARMILPSETYYFHRRDLPRREGVLKNCRIFAGAFYAHPGWLTFGVPPASTRPSRTLSASSRSHAYGISDTKCASAPGGVVH